MKEIYWLVITVEENWLICKDKNIYGIPVTARLRDPRKYIRKNDYLVFYVPKRKASKLGGMFVGVYKVVSDWYREDKPFWPDEKRENKVKYPFRVRIEPIKQGCVSLDEIKNKLKFIKNYRNIGLAFRGTPANNGNPLPIEDVKTIIDSFKPCPDEGVKDLEEKIKCEHEEISYEDIKNHVLEKLFIDEDTLMLINSLLDAGENVLLVGYPGTGKTSLAREIAIARGYKPYYVVATAHWSRYDVIGGLMLEGGEARWRSGFLIRAIVKHIENSQMYKKCSSGVRGVYLIIDEVNRADVDKAFAEFFLIFSSHNPSERIIPEELVEEIKGYVKKGMADKYAKRFIEYLENENDEGKEYLAKVKVEDAVIGYRVPLDFRIIATMNQVDVRNLFTLGDAFARRFAIVEIKPPSNIDKLLDKIYENIKAELGPRINEIESIIKDVRSLIDEKLKKLYKETNNSYTKTEKGTSTYLVISPANLYRAIKSFITTYLSLKKSGKEIEDLDKVLRKCIETSLPLSRLWDRRVRKHVNEVLDSVFEKKSTQ